MITRAFEVVVVGGGAAGLSAALVLGRCARRVLLCDDGQPRNRVSKGVHGFITHDGIAPAEFLRLGREQVRHYPGVTLREGRVDDVVREGEGFRLRLAGGEELRAETLLLATGLIDELPEIEGFRRCWGHSAFICPFCDAWEVRGQRFAVLGDCPALYEYALELRQWSPEVVVCTDARDLLTAEHRAHFARLRLQVVDTKVVALEGDGPQVERLRFADGTALETRVVFLMARQHQRSPLAEKLGCPFNPDGTIPVDEASAQAAPGVWVAGNAAAGLQMAMIAAAEGLKAAHAINEVLGARALRGT